MTGRLLARLLLVLALSFGVVGCGQVPSPREAMEAARDVAATTQRIVDTLRQAQSSLEQGAARRVEATPTASTAIATPQAPTPAPTPLRSGDSPRLPMGTATPTALTAVRYREGPGYGLYFTAPFYPEGPANRYGGLDAALVRDLDAARQSIDVASFAIDLPSVTAALARAAQRGVQVRVVTDDESYDEVVNGAAIDDALARAGVQMSIDHGSGYSHNKFAIIDDKILWTGSWNLTTNDTYRNNNNMLRLTEPRLIKNYQQRFEEFMAGRFHGQADKTVPNPKITLANGVTIENYFSPNGGARAAIQARLEAAKKSIRVLAFSLTADKQADILIAKRRAGLQVQGVVESRNASGSGAEYDRLKNAGVDVLKDGNCYVMHHKVYIIDDRTVITGSYNFSGQAETDNDENLLIIDDPNLAAHYIDEFNRIYNQAQHPSCGS